MIGIQRVLDLICKLTTILKDIFIAILTPGKVPPIRIPPSLKDRYTLHGKIRYKFFYFNDARPPHKPVVYNKKDLESYASKAGNKEMFYYGKTDLWLYSALEKYKIENNDVAIMGSVRPAYESICLAYGGRPTTIDYNKIISEDPRLKTTTVAEYDTVKTRFDAAFSISSFEHDGLGRYGDALNPDGDLEAMEKLKSMLKPNGILFLAVPVGADALVWNAHRIYGRIRLPMLLEGWTVLDTFGFDGSLFDKDCYLWCPQPVFVLKNDGKPYVR